MTVPTAASSRLRRVTRAVRGTYAFGRLVQDMRRTDAVFKVFAEIADPERLAPVVAHLGSTPTGAQALVEQPRLGTVDLDALAALPAGTLGRLYAEHLTSNGLEPDFYPDVEINAPSDYVRLHFYETHDLWHVATGFGTDVAGELGLQAFYVAQFPDEPLPPLLLAAGLLNGVLVERGDMARRVAAISDGWERGRAAKPLFGLRWAERWEQPLGELRRELGTQAPAAARKAARKGAARVTAERHA